MTHTPTCQHQIMSEPPIHSYKQFVGETNQAVNDAHEIILHTHTRIFRCQVDVSRWMYRWNIGRTASPRFHLDPTGQPIGPERTMGFGRGDSHRGSGGPIHRNHFIRDNVSRFVNTACRSDRSEDISGIPAKILLAPTGQISRNRTRYSVSRDLASTDSTIPHDRFPNCLSE